MTVTASGVPGRASEIFRRQVSTGNTLAFGTPGNVKADFVYQRRVAAPPFAAAIAGETGTAPALGAKTLDCNVPALDPTRPTLGDIQVDVDVGHADRSRLRLALTAPDGTSVVLWEGGPGGVDLVGSFDRSLFPREPLDALVDVAYAGKWSLRVEDAADAAATVRSWSLRIRPRWEGPLHAARPALFVKSLKIKDGKKPLRDRLRLRAEIDVGEIVDDTAASRLSVVIEEAEAPHVELLRIPLTGEVGASGVVLTGGDVSHVFQPSPKGTSRSKLAVDVSGVDLPAFPRDLRVVIAMGDAVVGETIRTQRGSFRGARTAPPGGTLRIDRLKSRVHSLGRRTDVRGRLLLRGAAPVPGVLELRVGEATALWLNGPIDERQGALVYAPNGLVSRFTINPSTGRFVARVVGAAAVVDDDGRIPVSIWAAADFEAVEVRASLDVDGTYRY